MTEKVTFKIIHEDRSYWYGSADGNAWIYSSLEADDILHMKRTLKIQQCADGGGNIRIPSTVEAYANGVLIDG